MLAIKLLIKDIRMLIFYVLNDKRRFFEEFFTNIATVSDSCFHRHLTGLYLAILIFLLKQQIVFLGVLHFLRAVFKGLVCLSDCI